MDPSVIVAVIGALFGAGGIAAILKTRADNKKTEADAEITLTGGWRILYEASRAEINELRERLAIVEKHEQECQSRLSILERDKANSGGVSSAELEKKVVSLIQTEIEKRGEKVDRSV